VQFAFLYGWFFVFAIFERQANTLSVFMIFYSVCSFTNFCHYVNYHKPISNSAVVEIMTTTLQEMREYLLSQKPIIFVFFVIYAMFCVANVVALHVLRKPEFPYAEWFAVGLVVAALAVVVSGKGLSLYPLRYFVLIGSAALEIIRFNRLTHSKGRYELVVCSPPTLSSQKFVVVIGESVRRSNLSIYGYQRDTTPALRRVQDQLIVFEDAISPSNTTRASLKYALTPASLDRPGVFDPSKSIIQSARQAGFETLWISNQGRIGRFETQVSVMAAEAERSVFLNSGLESSRPDGEMLPFLQDALSSKQPALIFVHMMGSHFRYDLRIEDKFHRYTKNNNYYHNIKYKKLITDNYDNTIYYLDNFISNVINLCEYCGHPSVVSFFSDHAEVLFDDGRSFGHALAKPLKKEFEVPYFYWVATAFRQQFPNNVLSGMPPRNSNPAHLQYLFDDLSLILGIDYSNYKPPATNLLTSHASRANERKVLSHDNVRDFASLP
jgi:heptose-I-phosphate ethanolaminephosphotransferase